MDRIKAIWEDLQRPSADVLLRELRRLKVPAPPGEVRAFVNRHASAQVFSPAPRSNGHIVAFAPHSVYQVDLLDQSGRDPAHNEGYRYGLMVVDVYSRRLAGVLLRSKAPGETAGAFRRACTVLGGFPKTLYSDEGGEFAGAFDALAREHGVQRVIRDPRHTNALAVVDSLIGRVRRAMAREMVESGSESWVGAFRKACDAMNRRPLEHLLGARPVDVEHNAELRYSLNYQAGEEARQLTGQLEAQEARLRQAGAFRTLLPRGRFDKTGKPRWSAEVHQLAGIEHGWAVGTDGARERVRFTLPVGKDSRSVRLPQAVAGGDNARDALRREKLKPYIEALAAHLGDGSLHVQQAGEFLGKLAGWKEALTELQLRNQNLRQILGLFQELKVAGNFVSR